MQFMFNFTSLEAIRMALDDMVRIHKARARAYAIAAYGTGKITLSEYLEIVGD